MRSGTSAAAAAIGFLAIGAVVFGVSLMHVTIWAIADSLGRQTSTKAAYYWEWVLTTAGMLQVVLSALIGKLILEKRFPRIRLVLDVYTLGFSVAMVLLFSMDGAPAIFPAVAVAFLAVTMVVTLRERWLDWLSFAWAFLVVLVLASAMYHASVGSALLLASLLVAAFCEVWIATHQFRRGFSSQKAART